MPGRCVVPPTEGLLGSGQAVAGLRPRHLLCCHLLCLATKVYLIQGLGSPHTLSCSAMSAVPLQAEVTPRMVCLHGGISHGFTHSLVREQLKVSKGSLGDP